MGEHTPNLNLYKPKATQPVEKGWGALVNESIDVIDTELNAAAKSVFLVGDVVNYVSNAVYTGGKWNRRNTGLGATRVAFDPSARTITVYYVNAGANPITWVKVETFSTSGIDMGGKKVANMATPSVASDAATKGYIDGLIAALKLSQIAIDANKNWNGKSITNIGAVTSQNIVTALQFRRIQNYITTTAGGTVLAEASHSKDRDTAHVTLTRTAPAGITGQVELVAKVTFEPAQDWPGEFSYTLKKNGTIVASLPPTSVSSVTGREDTFTTPVAPGDTFELQATCTFGGRTPTVYVAIRGTHVYTDLQPDIVLKQGTPGNFV